MVKEKSITINVLIILILLASSLSVNAEQNTLKNQKDNSSITTKLISVYQRFISPINQGSCPMHPNCSNYAYQAFDEYNPIKAWLKTSDRLLRCENDLSNYQDIRIDRMIRYKDPVDYKYSSNLNISQPRFIEERIETEIKNKNIQATNEKLLYHFAKELEMNKEYEKAITEYRRLLSYYPDTKYRGVTLQSILNLLYKQEKYLEVVDFGIDILSTEQKEIVDSGIIKYLMGSSYLNLDNQDLAREYLKEINDDKLLKDKAILLIGLSFAQEENWEKAKSYFENIDDSSELYSLSQKSIQLSQEGKKLNYKNPKVATALGIVPGLGYLYNGYKETALSSLVINSLFVWGTKRAFENDNKGLGILSGAFGIGFYIGNIYGSYQITEIRNERVRQEHLLKFNLEF